jgi:hypothetical protein
MNSIINVCGKHALFHTVKNAEFTGIYDKLVYDFANNPGDNRNGFICNYHFFIRYGDKIYMDVKGIGEIVITFTELQQNKYWKHYYDISLMLTNSKDKNLVIQYHKYGSEYLSEKIYEEPRLWSFNTAYIETSMNSKDTHIKNYGNICYYKINPYDLVNMEYTSQEDLDIFKINYITKRPEIKNKVFDIMCIIYKNLAVDYNTQIIKNEIDEMEKELEELSVMFEDKKNIINLVILNNRIGMNDDIQMMIYNYIISHEGYTKYKAIMLDNSNKLVSIAQIMAV